MATVAFDDDIQKTEMQRVQASFGRSQLILFQSRKKFGLLYALGTIAGLFCIPGTLGNMLAEADVGTLLLRTVPLPLISLLVSVGMYILNDLVDADLDRANRKKRPIPSGQVSKNQAWIFIFLTNGLALALAAITGSPFSMILVAPMFAIGIMYSAPRVSLMKRFVIKNASISVFYVLCALLGMTAGYGVSALDDTTVMAALNALMALGIMIFVGSILNDLGDIKGDRAEGRRTIPIVLGGKRTIQVLVVMLVFMPVASFMLLILGFGLPVITTVGVSIVAVLGLLRIMKIRQGLPTMNTDFMRKQHRKWFPLHAVLQSSLALGVLVI